MQTFLANWRMHLRRAAPWLLFGVWLSASAARLWALEMESLESGTLCTGPAAQTDWKFPSWLQDLLP